MARKISFGLGALLLAFGVGVLIAVLVWRDVAEHPAVPADQGYEEATSTPPVVEERNQRTIGYSVEGRPIEVYTFGTGAKELLFVGGVHGGYEWNSVVLAYEMIEHMGTFPETVPSTLRVSIIPALNPDGVFTVVGTTSPFTEADVAQKEQTA